MPSRRKKSLQSFVLWILIGYVEKTDTRSADYPLTPTPRTTLRTTPRTTLWTTYTIITVRKPDAISFHRLPQPSLFSFLPHSSSATCQKPRFLNWLLNSFFLICFKTLQVFAIDTDICWKSALLNFPYIWKNRDHRRWRPDITNRWTKLILWYFLANVDLRQIKEIDFQECLPI